MAPAALEDTMSSSFEAPTSTQDARNDDPWTPLARRNVNVYEQEPHRAPSSATASIGSSPTAVFSSREPSVVTKPTTNGTFYPVYDDNGKGKAIVAATYAASLSATHGSASEAEEGRDDARRFALLGTGAWLSDQHAEERCLRRSGNAKVRLSKALPHRLKKPPFELHQTARHAVSYESPAVLPAIATPTHIANGPRCLLDCVPRQHYVMLGMVSLVVTTIALGGVSIHRADSANLAHRKRVIIIATVLVTLETILTMFAARRTLLEALMLGFFPLVIGFMFLLHPEIII